jgi:Tol biopolymer transport system component
MSSIDWVPELAAALDDLVPLDDGRRGDWSDVVARAGRPRQLRRLMHRRPRRSLRLAIVVALLFLLLAGVATATYLLVRGNGGIAFGGGDGGGKLVVVNPNGHRLHAIASCGARNPGCSIQEPSWSPDGTRVAFLRGSLTGGAGIVPSHMVLYVTAANGASPRRLASCGICGLQYQGQHLGWSPDGRLIAFSRDSGPTQAYQSLWVVAAAGGKPHRITDCRASCADIQPVWSPDGHLIAFQRGGRANGATGLYTVRPDGSHLTRIASTWGQPEWSPDGRRIAFDYGPDSIAVANADGSHLQVLLAGHRGGGPGAPAWSPDGRQLVFANTPRVHGGFSYEVWTMNADGSGTQRLYRSPCCVFQYASPIWSPNGRMIAFAANSAGGTFVISTDGTGLHRVSPDISDELSWQPIAKGQDK